MLGKSVGIVVAAAAWLAGHSGTGAAAEAFFQSATYGGAGNIVTLQRVPVRTDAGTIIYRDVRITFRVGPNGALSLEAGSPAVSASPVLITGDFVAGRYKHGNGDTHTLSGPSVSPNGRTTWSIVGEGVACSLTAGWTTGPISGHPWQKRLNAAGIRAGDFAYGVFGDDGCLDAGIFGQGHLLGASGSPTGITLFSYTDTSGDHATPVGQTSYTRCTASDPCP